MGLILVTGAAGFIGYHSVQALLARGEKVLGIDNLNAYYDIALKKARLQRLQAHKNFTFIEADIADSTLPNLLSPFKGKIDRVLHLAAQAGVRYSLEAPQTYIQSNLVGHFNMLEWAHGTELRHFVYASSSSVYGHSTRLPFALDDPADNPASIYAATKRSAELLSQTYANLYSLPQTGLRFFTVYGPWGRPDMAYFKFTRAILEGQPITLYNNGKMQRDFTYIDDIVSGILAALDRPPLEASWHRLYNFGNDRPEELGHLVAILEKACGKKAITEMAPMQKGEVVATWADISASRRDFGYTPKTRLEEGLPHFVEWYRSFYGVV